MIEVTTGAEATAPPAGGQPGHRHRPLATAGIIDGGVSRDQRLASDAVHSSPEPMHLVANRFSAHV